MEFDPVGSAQSIPDMINNDTLIEVLDEDQLSECLKHITLNVDQSLYILDQVRSKYKVPDRFKAVCHIITDFGVGQKFDTKKFVEFIKSLGRCLNIDILESIATIIESEFFKNSQKTSSKPENQTQNNSVSKNIEELKKIPKTEENFDNIYEICQKIATEKDKDAMSFAVRKKFVYVTEKGGNGTNIFTKAVFDSMQDLIHLLIESGIDINSRDKYENTALIIASYYGYNEVVKYLLGVPGIDVNATDGDNNTALICASKEGHHEIVKLLLNVPGVDVNAKDNDNNTALIWVSKFGRHETVKLLLTAPGINVNIKDEDNKTALIWASSNNYPDVVKHLIIAPGIKVNAKDDYNKTALIWASSKDYPDIVRLLLTVPGIDVNTKDNDNNTALILASYYGYHDVVTFLLTDPRIDVNVKDANNKTALILASQEGHHKIVKMLEDQGAI